MNYIQTVKREIPIRIARGFTDIIYTENIFSKNTYYQWGVAFALVGELIQLKLIKIAQR